jgi:hypothetical protein
MLMKRPENEPETSRERERGREGGRERERERERPTSSLSVAQEINCCDSFLNSLFQMKIGLAGFDVFFWQGLECVVVTKRAFDTTSVSTHFR